MKGGLVAKRIDDTPVYVEDVVRMTGAVIPEDAESSEPEDVESSEPTGAADPLMSMSLADKRLVVSARGHSRRKKGDGPVTVGARTFEATRVCGEAPVSSEGGGGTD